MIKMRLCLCRNLYYTSAKGFCTVLQPAKSGCVLLIGGILKKKEKETSRIRSANKPRVKLFIGFCYQTHTLRSDLCGTLKGEGL